MKKRWKILLSVLSVSLICLYLIGQTVLKRDPISQKFPLKQIWKAPLSEGVVGLSVASDELILARTSSSLNALDTKNGKVIWRQALSWQADPHLPIVENGKVYVMDGDFLMALDQDTGSVLWRQSTTYTESWVTDASESIVIVNQVGVDIMVFDANTGKFLWRKPVCRGYVQAFIYDQQVYIPCYGLEAVDAISGKISWEVDVDVVGNIGFSKDTVYYYSDSVEAYGLQNRKILWNIPLAQNGLENFRVFKDALFYTDASRACLIDITSGQLKWCAKLLYPQTPIMLGNNVYIFDGNHKTITVHHASDGDKTGELRLSNLNYFIIDRQLLISARNLLFFANGKYVYAYGD